MRISHTFAAAAIALAAFGIGSANAGVVLSDDFGTTGAEGNWAGDSVFLSIPQPGDVNGKPSVDLVGPGFFDNLAFSGNSVDLDGSTGNGNDPAGEIQSKASLAASSAGYTVSFELAGNLRGAADEETVVSIGGDSINLGYIPNNQGYTLYHLHFIGASGQLDFKDLPTSDQQGNLLDNVVVTTGVPEPATWTMMILGFGAVGFFMRRRKAVFA